MKNIEQLIKESLENHEVPFNEAAWESMSKRLDGTTPSPFYRKWWVAASVGTVLVGSALFFALNSQSESSKTPETHTSGITQTNTTSSSAKEHEDQTTNETNPQTHTLKAETQASPEAVHPSIEQEKHQLSEANTPVAAQKGEPASKRDPQITPNSTVKPTVTDAGAPKTNYLPAIIAKTNYCIGDEIEISNPNESIALTVVQNNRTLLTVKPGAKRIITASAEGSIEVLAGNQKQTVQVHKPASDLYISVDPTLLYESGIPAIRFTVSGNDNPVSWKVENHPSEVENGTLVVHPYKGKEITVSAISKDMNNCPAVETKTIQLPEDYKLNAAQAIDLNSGDIRNSTFMPLALKERNTPFELYIYDSKTGRVIFKTTDASNGWNGVDSNTGEVLKVGSVVMWKVVLGDPNPGEPKEYKGTVVVTAK